jgi:hypothetical protein
MLTNVELKTSLRFKERQIICVVVLVIMLGRKVYLTE